MKATTLEITHKDIALRIFSKFKSPMFYDPMIRKVIQHEAFKQFCIEDLTEEDINMILDMLIAADNVLGNGGYDF